MPDIHFECSKCKQTLNAPEELASQLIECPTCKETIEVPSRSQPTKPPLPPPSPTPARVPDLKLPVVEDSVVAIVLMIIGALDIVGSLIAAIAVGGGNPYLSDDGNSELGWLIFLSGALSGLILIGFARVIQHSAHSAQRLRRIEMLIQKIYDDKKAA
jgi:hypothetical protein